MVSKIFYRFHSANLTLNSDVDQDGFSLFDSLRLINNLSVK